MNPSVKCWADLDHCHRVSLLSPPYGERLSLFLSLLLLFFFFVFFVCVPHLHYHLPVHTRALCRPGWADDLPLGPEMDPPPGTRCEREKLRDRPRATVQQVQEKISKLPGAALGGYMPLRGDFDLEHDNDAEQILADMEVGIRTT